MVLSGISKLTGTSQNIFLITTNQIYIQIRCWCEVTNLQIHTTVIDTFPKHLNQAITIDVPLDNTVKLAFCFIAINGYIAFPLFGLGTFYELYQHRHINSPCLIISFLCTLDVATFCYQPLFYGSFKVLFFQSCSIHSHINLRRNLTAIFKNKYRESI